MRLIEKFAEEVLSNNGSFTIEIPHNNENGISIYHFLQDEVGKARYVYGISNYLDVNFYAKLDCNPKIVAILSEEKIYILDIFFFDIYSYGNNKIILPDNVVIFNDYVKKQNDYVCNVVFPEFYGKLKTDENSITDSEKTCKERAREIVLYKSNNFDEVKLRPIFNEQDIANHICGLMDFQEEITHRLDSDKETWIRKKSTDKKIKEFVDDLDIAASWEMEITNGIRNVEAKTVTVEFELNEKRASAKINPETIIRKMVYNDYFSEYDFEITKRGDELIKELGAGKWWNNENALKCKHITKITYGKKELYVRNQL